MSSPTTPTGEETHSDIGLVHMNGRIYDPLLGRFLSADLLVQDPTNLQCFNRYSYVQNNPLTLTDPTGWYSEEGLGKLLASPQYGTEGEDLMNTLVRDDTAGWTIQSFNGTTLATANNYDVGGYTDHNGGNPGTVYAPEYEDEDSRVLDVIRHESIHVDEAEPATVGDALHNETAAYTKTVDFQEKTGRQHSVRDNFTSFTGSTDRKKIEPWVRKSYTPPDPKDPKKLASDAVKMPLKWGKSIPSSNFARQKNISIKNIKNAYDAAKKEQAEAARKEAEKKRLASEKKAKQEAEAKAKKEEEDKKKKGATP